MIGTEFHEYMAHTEQHPSAFGEGMMTTKREMKPEEEHSFAEGEFYGFDPGVR